jgi:hypothetical protein
MLGDNNQMMNYTIVINIEPIWSVAISSGIEGQMRNLSAVPGMPFIFPNPQVELST